MFPHVSEVSSSEMDLTWTSAMFQDGLGRRNKQEKNPNKNSSGTDQRNDMMRCFVDLVDSLDIQLHTSWEGIFNTYFRGPNICWGVIWIIFMMIHGDVLCFGPTCFNLTLPLAQRGALVLAKPSPGPSWHNASYLLRAGGMKSIEKAPCCFLRCRWFVKTARLRKKWNTPEI